MGLILATIHAKSISICINRSPQKCLRKVELYVLKSLEAMGRRRKEKDIFLLKMSIKTHLITLSHFIFFFF